MRLIVLGSSSKGNGYLLDNGKCALMIECGVPFRDVERAMNFDISRIGGAVISHGHGDHARYAKSVMERHIPVYCSGGTADEIGIAGDFLCRTMRPGKNYMVGQFCIEAFETQHDAAQPFGFLIYHPECGTVLFATDTFFLKYTFADLNNILIECNYKLSILDGNVDAGLLPTALRGRTMKSHMELDQCRDTLLANDLSRVNNIVLIHLSEGNGDPQLFKREIEEATGKCVTVARPGLVIENFDRSPF